MHAPTTRLDARLVDAVVVAGTAAVGLFGLVAPVVIGSAAATRVTSTAVVLILVQAGTLWWRRRHPVAALAVALGVLLAAEALGDVNAPALVGPHVAAYSAGVHARRDLLAVWVVAAAALAEVLLALAGAAGTPATVLVGPTGLLLGVAWGGGRYVRVRRAYVETLVAYAHQVEADRDEQARRAVAEERRRIARELHDQVAHHLGVVALQTGAARRWLTRDPERASQAMAAAEQAVRGALTTMPVILEALRSDGASDLAPEHGVEDLPALVARVSSAGLPVELVVEGDRRELAPAVESTAYRIVQEALTNTMKHAGRARATVRLRYEPRELLVEVSDDGRGLASATPQGGGFGLRGMRERVDLLGGGLEAGVRVSGGFTVRATLPLQREEAAT